MSGECDLCGEHTLDCECKVIYSTNTKSVKSFDASTHICEGSENFKIRKNHDKLLIMIPEGILRFF